MNRTLRTIAPCAVPIAFVAVAVALAGCYSRILPEPSQDRLAVAGAPNTRDLGGLPGHEGRAVRRGLLVRSGELDRLTPRGQDFLFGGGQMGIETVVDFRCAALRLDFAEGEVSGTSSERSRAPGRMPDGVLWPGDTGIPEGVALDDIIWRRDIDFDHVVRDVLQWYRNLVTNHRAQYLEFFRALLAADGPVLFHCSTGKDRAGVAAALLLMALGVSDEDIVADYMLSKGLLHEKLFPVVPFVRGEMARDMHGKRLDALFLVRGTPDEAARVQEGLRREAERGILRRHMQGVFSGIMSGDPGMSPGLAVERAKEEMARLLAGLEDEQDLRDAIDLAFEGSVDWMRELGGIPGDDFDGWVRDFAWNAGNKIQPLLSVFPQWIEAALDEVRVSFGGIEGFLDGLGDDAVARLRELYLEPGL